MADRPWITVKSEAHVIPDELARELAGLIIEWSGFESAIVLDTNSMRRFRVVQKLFKEEPRSFKRKIESWKDAVLALFPEDKRYGDIATLICSEGKIVARYRHALIHSHWLPPESPGAPFRLRLTAPLDKLPEGYLMPVTGEFVTAVHQRLRQMSDNLWTFTTNRMLHGRLARKRAPREPEH